MGPSAVERHVVKDATSWVMDAHGRKSPLQWSGMWYRIGMWEVRVDMGVEEPRCEAGTCVIRTGDGAGNGCDGGRPVRDALVR
jgi:hypothetical protein